MYRFSAKNFSDSAGVYLMYGKRLPHSARNDEKGLVLYVGKAKNLKKRLASYFSGSAGRRDSRLAGKRVSPKTEALVQRIHKIDTIVVKNELEALLLENELIKKYRPPFNIVMRDDKSYLYIRITTNEEFPRILLARKMTRDGAKYFGPYASSGPVYEILKLIKRVFPLCSSEQRVSGSAGQRVSRRACLNYHLKICPGVCLGKVESKEYHQTIEQVMQFLHGNYPPVIQKLKAEMLKASVNKEFERAARLRDGLQTIEKINERQSVIKTNLSVSEDAIGVARELNKAMVVLLQVRSGKLLNQQQYALDTKYETEVSEILAGFLRDYYVQAADLPKVILLPEAVDDVKTSEKWLTNLVGRTMKIHVPTKGRQRAIVRLAQSNAAMKFHQVSGRWQLEKLVATEGVEGLKQILKLKSLTRIEAYDISNTAGTDSVGAMVVWEKGQLDKKQYRRFKIKTVAGPNDFASLAEVLQRRFAHQTGDDKFTNLPNVVLIDGGKGQVSTVAKVLKNFKVAVIGIAKGSHSRTKAKDELVIAGQQVSRSAGQGGRKTITEILPDNSPTKILLQNIRDEAHRFAIAYHTHLRKQRTTNSAIEKVAGVGAVTRKLLIKKFGSMAGVKKASEAEIANTVGNKLARKIKDEL